MNAETSDTIINVILCMLLLIAFIISIYLVFFTDAFNEDINSFCIKNGYAGARLLNPNEGYCFSYETGEKHYFAKSSVEGWKLEG